MFKDPESFRLEGGLPGFELDVIHQLIQINPQAIPDLLNRDRGATGTRLFRQPGHALQLLPLTFEHFFFLPDRFFGCFFENKPVSAQERCGRAHNERRRGGVLQGNNLQLADDTVGQASPDPEDIESVSNLQPLLATPV